MTCGVLLEHQQPRVLPFSCWRNQPRERRKCYRHRLKRCGQDLLPGSDRLYDVKHQFCRCKDCDPERCHRSVRFIERPVHTDRDSVVRRGRWKLPGRPDTDPDGNANIDANTTYSANKESFGDGGLREAIAGSVGKRIFLHATKLPNGGTVTSTLVK